MKGILEYMVLKSSKTTQGCNKTLAINYRFAIYLINFVSLIPWAPLTNAD